MVYADDGRCYTEDIRASINSVTIFDAPVDDLNHNRPLPGDNIIVYVVTKQVLDIIKRKDIDNKSFWFNNVERTIVVYTDISVVQAFNRHIASVVPDWANVKAFDVMDKRQWLYAEAEVKYLLEEAANLPFRGTRNFIFKPNTVSILVSTLTTFRGFMDC